MYFMTGNDNYVLQPNSPRLHHGNVIPQHILACHIVSGSLKNLQGYEKKVEVHLNTNQLLQISQQKSVK